MMWESMEYLDLRKAGNFFINRETTRFSQRTICHEVIQSDPKISAKS